MIQKVILILISFTKIRLLNYLKEANTFSLMFLLDINKGRSGANSFLTISLINSDDISSFSNFLFINLKHTQNEFQVSYSIVQSIAHFSSFRY